MKGLLEEYFSYHLETALRDPLLFSDYRTALNTEVPKIYEDIQDYDAAKGLFEEVHMFSCICKYWIVFLNIKIKNFLVVCVRIELTTLALSAPHSTDWADRPSWDGNKNLWLIYKYHVDV